MIMIMEAEVDQIELFLKQIVSTIAHKETRDTAVKLVSCIKAARGGYKDGPVQ